LPPEMTACPQRPPGPRRPCRVTHSRQTQRARRMGDMRADAGEGGVIVETALGACALLGSDAGISGVHLPEPSRELLRSRIEQEHPEAVEYTAPTNDGRAPAGGARAKGMSAEKAPPAMEPS